MIRKLILSAVLAAGATAGVASTANAAPDVFDRHDRRDVRFEVKVRHHGHWDTYGTYRDRDDAQRVVRMLERRGQDARIEVERSRW
ncbi:hypothetical protein GobsT_24030 [Gemmata obscuriglobus]|uniref:SPOR domain-containing protein n=1 Tax=Gemmata obscuriglobus TaxID=114 RepID=A0A2Z3HC98_9BACT|nr:hypothetical protein [Gemmata obscuriglobus]AWM39294.1 hypothetical protein C1280_21425 [Gemmata obscuriglobus]QEG27644.1 hypothetical protein GobsT_24030 [Gemmata obscuriglobus]VTS04811.1 unnamed protein product [Gemmata obscuriglobus UQM 2246]